jgi:hypothetical protein
VDGTSGSRFYAVNDRPVAVVPVPGGGVDCVVFDFATGELVPDRAYFGHVTGGSGKDVDVLTEAEFEARLAACRAEAGARAAARMRQWAEQLCATAGTAVPVAAALGLHGSMWRGYITVDHPPAGFSEVRVITVVTTGAGVCLRPAGQLVTKSILDAEFGAARELPMNLHSDLVPFAYRVDVAGAAAHCMIFAEFRHPGMIAAEILLRRDTLG